jgi:hypothetical protein
MVCYARPLFRMTVIAVAALLVFGGPLRHLLGTVEFVVAATAVTAVLAVASALAFAAVMSTRRGRAAAGGCVHCRFRCQHAMTEAAAGRPSRLWLVATADRRTGIPDRDTACGPGPLTPR